MKDYKRKDKLLITILVLSALLMSIANPANYDIRDIAWDFCLYLMFGAALLWIISEIGDFMQSLALGLESRANGGFSKRELEGLTREQLLALASDAVDDPSVLEGLSDDDLMRLIMSKNGASSGEKRSKTTMITRVYKIVKFCAVSLLYFAILFKDYIKDAWKSFRTKKKRTMRLNISLGSLKKERKKLLKELQADGKDKIKK